MKISINKKLTNSNLTNHITLILTLISMVIENIEDCFRSYSSCMKICHLINDKLDYLKVNRDYDTEAKLDYMIITKLYDEACFKIVEIESFINDENIPSNEIHKARDNIKNTIESIKNINKMTLKIEVVNRMSRLANYLFKYLHKLYDKIDTYGLNLDDLNSTVDGDSLSH